MRFRVLGELEVVDGDAVVPIRGARQRALLLLLLVRARETVQAERLADELWGDFAPSGGANALQALVSKLRRALGESSSALVTGPGGYRLDVADDDIDARRFATEVERGRAALAAGELHTAAEVLAGALALWRGPALDGCDEAVLRQEATRLEELRWAAVEDRIDADLRCGASSAIVPELEHLVTRAPLRERLHGFLMLALYRSGRQAEALRAFQAARDVLGEELGLEPGPALRALESAILDQDPALDLRPVAPVAPVRRRTNLSPPLSSFVGRTADLDALGRVVAEQRLVTVIGPGGAGKTRLSQEVGLRRSTDEDVWLVELAPVADPVAVPDALVSGLQVPDHGRIGGAEAAGSAPALARVADHIGDRPTLVLLDNCEHVVGEAARVAEELLRACPALRILATSREALAVGGETLWPIPPLAPADATALFTDRASAVGGLDPAAAGPGAGADALDAIDDLCRRLDGLPLAIELAAARTRAIPVGQLATRLDDRFRLLTGGARTAMPRQQTLRAVVEWSYDLLFTDEQRVFDRLAVFAGGCSLDAAEVVCAGGEIDPLDVAEILGRLVDKSLVVADRSGDQARFRLLQTLALYGRERLVATGEADVVRDRHAAYFGELCARGPAAFKGKDQTAWHAEAVREADNIRAALAWRIDQGDAESALAIAGGIGWRFWLSGSDEGVRLLDAALGCPGSASPACRGLALTWASAVRANSGGSIDLAVAQGEQAIELWREAGDAEGWRDALAVVAGVHVTSGNRDRALELFDEAGERFGAEPDDWSQAVAASMAGRAASIRGDLESAAALQHRCARCFEAAGVTWAMVAVTSDVALVEELRGNLEAARHATGKALAAARELGLGLGEAQLLARLGNLALLDGDADSADALHDEALRVGERVGARLGTAFALVGRATSRRLAGRLDEATAAAARGLELYRSADAALGQARALSVLGFVAEQRGRLDEARRIHREAYDLVVGREGRLTALALEGLAGVAAGEGDGERAARLLGRAGRLRSEAGGAPAGHPADVERITAAARTILGDDAAYALAHRRGAEAADDV